MDIRELIINGIVGGFLGWLMDSIGYSMNKWQFWAVILSVAVLIINN